MTARILTDDAAGRATAAEVLRAGGIVVTVEVLGTALRSALDRMHIKK